VGGEVQKRKGLLVRYTTTLFMCMFIRIAIRVCACVCAIVCVRVYVRACVCMCDLKTQNKLALHIGYNSPSYTISTPPSPSPLLSPPLPAPLVH